MAKRDKYRKNKASEFFDYTEGKLSDRERNAFERRMQKDPFDADAAEGFSSVSREEAEQDLHNAAVKIRRRLEGVSSSTERSRRIARAGSRTKRNRRIAWYSAAAAIASMMIVTTVFFRLNDNGLERFETAPEMREAAREQSAPLQEGEVEQEEPVGEDGMDREGSLGEEAKDEDEPLGKDLKEQPAPLKEGTRELDERIEKETKELPVVAEEEPPEIEEDHAFARKKMNEEAAAGRYNETQQRMITSKAPPEPETAYDLQAPVAAADNVKREQTVAEAVEETDPSGSEEYESAAPEKGMADFRSYIDTTLVYPELTETSGRKVVVLKFSVAPDGRPQNFRVIRAPDNEAFEKEAIRVVSEGPAWQPATRNGQHTEEEVRLRIVFRKD